MTDKKTYKDTLNLPKTSFSMKANLTQKEPMLVKRWLKEDLYGKIRDAYKSAPKYTMHDGPPYANGDIHMGHALNKTLKDIVTKFWTMNGYNAPFVPGWDCHGLPIEHKILLELGDKARETDSTTIRKKCAKFAEKFVKIQKQQFQRFMILADWDNPYLTMRPQYEAGVIETFRLLVEKGYIYRGLRPIHWCTSCTTALAEAEIEYAVKKSPSVFVKFPTDSGVAERFGVETNDNIHFLIWTTTPWTLPANLAIAVNEKVDYCLVEYAEDDKKHYVIVAKKLVEKVFEAAGKTVTKIHGSVKGADLLNVKYRHPFIDRESPLVLADYVSVEDGTGCVHTAPGHGRDDYITGLKNKLPILSPVDKEGKFSYEAPEFLEGLHVYDGNPKVIELLQEQGDMFHNTEISHDYPHCWRCSNPVIFRASEQWFVNVDHDDLRKNALEAIEKEIKWLPEWGINRITSMVAERPDWCISRQRFWGVPIPAFYCEDCGHSIATNETTAHVRDIFAEKGANTWFYMDIKDLLPEGFGCPECKSNNLVQEHDIFDVWFESGSSHRSVVMHHEDMQYPADLYLEGSDQHRGWFQLSLLPAVAGTGQAPTKHIVTHGFTVDEHGKKESKSAGNYIAAVDAVAAYGADVLRLLFASVNYTNDISINKDIIHRMGETYRTIRNRFRFMLGNLNDFDASADLLDYDQLQDVDRWILHRTGLILKDVKSAYTSCQFYKLYHSVYNFLEVDLSSFYMDAMKDRLYANASDDPKRRSAQTALYHVLISMTKALAPILSYTCEELWQIIHKYDEKEPLQSVHMEAFPAPDDKWHNEELAKRWSQFLTVRDETAKVLEAFRNTKAIGSFMEANVIFACDDAKLKETLESFGDELNFFLIVSDVKLVEAADDSFTDSKALKGLSIKVEKSEHQKCERCWNLRADVGTIDGKDGLCTRCAAVV